MSPVRLLVFGDAHIKPVETAVDFDRLSVPSDVDAVLSLGDVVHDTREDALAYGREFFERLGEPGVPVVAVPGNHDPHEHYERFVGGLDAVHDGHDRVVSPARLGDPGSDRQLCLVGWGCEGFDQGPELDVTAFPGLFPADPDGDRRYVADRVAGRVEDALRDHVAGEADPRALADRLGVREDNRGAFLDGVERTAAVYRRVAGLVEEAEGPTVVCSHVPPYNTEADRHHSIGDRDHDVEGFHVGSIALTLALREHRPLAALHGHSHNATYERLGSGDPVHSLNLGFQGVATVTVDPRTGGFSYDRLAVE